MAEADAAAKGFLRGTTFSPFQVRAFRYQFPADIATSLAFEMETIILGWYVLVESGSVLLLTVFASLNFIGTLIAPMFGVMGDRIGHRIVLCAMRAIYATLALTLMVLALTGVLTPLIALGVAAITGLVRPSDIGMRSALIGESMPPDRLMGAMGMQRTTQDGSRIAGALTGAGLVAALGMGMAYAVVVTCYVASVFLTLRASGSTAVPAARAPAARPSPWRELIAGGSYVWHTPLLLGVMTLAFLLNMTAFPLYMSLLPVVAKEVYGAGQTTLGYMVAVGSFGAFMGSLACSRYVDSLPPARTMVIGGVAWLVAITVFAQLPNPAAGLPLLFLCGVAQGVTLVPMSTILLRNSEPQYRGRVMGIRMLAIYGNLPGLLLSGPLIVRFGYPTTATLYCIFGIGVAILIAMRWRSELWKKDAPANLR